MEFTVRSSRSKLLLRSNHLNLLHGLNFLTKTTTIPSTKHFSERDID